MNLEMEEKYIQDPVADSDEEIIWITVQNVLSVPASKYSRICSSSFNHEGMETSETLTTDV